MAQLYRVLYCSRNCVPKIGGAMQLVVDEILEVSRRNNARNGVTGGLLFTDGCFAQVLEGPIEAVEETFERIQCDDRHSDVTVLQACWITELDFPSWTMGFAGANGTDRRFGHLNLEHAFGSHAAGAEELLATLKGVILRQTEWLIPI